MSNIYQDLTQLSDKERQLLELLLSQEGIDDVILPQGRDSHAFPLSATQERLWGMAQFSLGTALGNVPTAFHIVGQLHIDALEHALADVVERHEVLRTCFRTINGMAQQIVQPDWRAHLAQIDLRANTESERLHLALKLAKKEANHAFDIEHEPCFRALLVQIEEYKYLLAITMNHLVTDGWGARILLQDLAKFYTQHVTGEESALPELNIQYADYSVWHNGWLDSDALQPQVDYWREQLTDASTDLVIQNQVRSSAIPTYECELHSFQIPTELTQNLRFFSQSNGVTLYITLLTAWQWLLYIYTASEDILVGTIISNRNRQEIEHLVGNFGNNLLIRCSFYNNPTFADILMQVSNAVLSAYEHPELPLERLDQILRSQGRGRQLPNFKNMFMLRESDLAQNFILPNIQLDEIPLYPNVMALDMIVDITDKEDQLAGSLEYKSAIYSKDFVEELIVNYRMLLAYIVEMYSEEIKKPLALSELCLPMAYSQEVNDVGHRLPLSSTDNSSLDHTTAYQKPHQSRAPETTTERILAEIWQNVLGIESIGADDNYFELGGNSLRAVQIFADIREAVDRELPLSVMIENPTIAMLAGRIDDVAWNLEPKSLVPIQPHGHKPPLFFIHSHGGNVVGYQDLSKYLGEEQPFYGLQSLGLHESLLPQTDLVEMAQGYRQEIQEVQPTGPYFLGGWCMGGDLALEIAHQLVAQEEDVAIVAMIQNPIPGEYPQYPETLSAFQLLRYRATELINIERSRYSEVASEVPAWTYTGRQMYKIAGQAWAKLWQNIFSIDDDPRKAVHHDSDDRLQLVADVNLAAYLEYKRKPYAGNVAIFRGELDPIGSNPDPTLGWGPLLQGNVEIFNLPGHGTGLTRPPKVKITAELMQTCLANALANTVTQGKALA